MKDKVSSISRDDIKFWLFLIGAFMGIVVWGVRLEGVVSAMEREVRDKGGVIRSDVDALIVQLNRMERNQAIIMYKLGLEPAK